MGQLWSPLFPAIGIDATYSLGSDLSGVGRYSVELLAALGHAFPQVQWKQYYRPHRYLRAPWPKHLLLDFGPRSCRLFHGLNQRLPKRSHCPSIATFHDLFVLTGDYSSPEFRRRFEAQARLAAAQSERLIAVSAFTAGQIVSLLGYPADRVHVVPHGVRWPLSVPSLDARKPAVLSVGAVQTRKNTARLITAFAALPPPWELWIAGSLGHGAEQMLASARTHPRIRLLGYVEDRDLERLYREAAIFAFPSLDEGFGIPVLEAMAHGLPVLTSNRSALPEVAGGAGLLVDPFDEESIAEGLRELTDPIQAARFAALGRERAKHFTWERSAQESAAVYEKVLGQRL